MHHVPLAVRTTKRRLEFGDRVDRLRIDVGQGRSGVRGAVRPCVGLIVGDDQLGITDGLVGRQDIDRQIVDRLDVAG